MSANMKQPCPEGINTPAFWQVANAWASSTIDTAARAEALVAYIENYSFVYAGYQLQARPTAGATIYEIVGLAALAEPAASTIERTAADVATAIVAALPANMMFESSQVQMTARIQRLIGAALERQRLAGRCDALEDAAAIAEYWAAGRKEKYGGAALRNCAVAIRAIKNEPVPLGALPFHQGAK